MIKNILTMLNAIQPYGVSERIDIIRGKYSIPTTYSDTIKKIKMDFNQPK